MKAIMISDKPKWCFSMMNGEKTIEVRTSKALAKATQKLIDKYGFAEFYVYCTKSSLKVSGKHGYKKELVVYGNVVNGKVAFKFRCYKVEKIYPLLHTSSLALPVKCLYHLDMGSAEQLSKKTCVNYFEMDDYLKRKNGYAIHISDLEIFDRPKEVNEFYKVGHHKDIEDFFTDEKRINGKWCIPLKKAPQNFCYVEVE